MAITIPKLITDITPYFKYENESGATTQDQFQAYLKNEHSVLEVLTKGLWQSSTAYTAGTIIHTPNMPESYVAICNTAGTSGANEPTWSAGSSSITDGTCNWRMVLIEHNAFTGATSSANGISGLVPAPTAGNQNKYLRADGTWQTPYTLPSATSSVLGGVKVGSNITNSSGTISLTKANVVAALGYTPPSNAGISLSSNVSTTKSTQLPTSEEFYNVGFSTSTKVNGIILHQYYANSEENVNKWMSGLNTSASRIKVTPALSVTYSGSSPGNYSCPPYMRIRDTEYINPLFTSSNTLTLQSLLQNLVNNSHSHTFTRTAALADCDCNCDCNDAG